MQAIPLKAEPNQSVTVLLDNQYCRVNVYQKSTGLFFDLYLGENPVVTTRICRDRVPLVLHSYLGFRGDFCFMDIQGKTDPEYSGIGSRFFLVYLP